MATIFPLHVVFYGLIAFVPNGQQTPPAYYALLPETTGGQYTSDGCHAPEHHPVMVIKAATCTWGGTNCTPDTTIPKKVQDICNDHGYFCFSLSKQELKIDESPAAGSHSHTKRTHGAVPRDDDDDDASDLYWLPSLDGKNKVNASCTAWASDRSCPIASRISLQHGYLATCQLVEQSHTACAYRFRSYHAWWPLNGDSVQAIASGTQVDYDINQSYVELSLAPLWSNTNKPLDLTPDPQHLMDGVTIWITDLSYDDDAMPAQASHCAGDLESMARHFEIYYDLLASQNGRPLPLVERPSPIEATGHCAKVTLSCPAMETRHPLQPTDLSACGHIMLTQ